MVYDMLYNMLRDMFERFTPGLKILRSSHRRCPVEKDVLKNLKNSQENTCARVSFF